MEKVLVLGTTVAVNRPSEYFQFFADHNDKFQFSFINLKIQELGVVSKSIELLSVVLKIFCADTILILPLSHWGRIAALVMFVSKLFNKKLIVDFYISAYEAQVVDREMYAPHSRQAKALRKNDINALKRSDLAIFLNRVEAQHYTGLLGLDLNDIKHVFIPLTIPKKELGAMTMGSSNAVFEVCWWGRLGNPIHGLEQILGAAARLKAFEARLKFVFFIDDNKEEERELYALVKKKKIEQLVTIRTDLNFTNGLPEYLRSNCDLALGLFGQSQKAQIVFTNKELDALWLGLPLVTMGSKAKDELLPRSKSILLCEANSEAIAQSIEYAYEHSDSIVWDKAELKSIVESNFSRNRFQKQLLQALTESRA